jgi:hypothetical protein
MAAVIVGPVPLQLHRYIKEVVDKIAEYRS